MPVAVAGDGHRVDREHRPAGRSQAGHQQPPAGLDRDRDRLLGAVSGLSEQLHQGREPVRIVTDASAGDRLTVGVDQGHVMVILGPVDPTEHPQRHHSPVPRSAISLPVEPLQGNAAP
jgi:hypothetical protein